MIKVNNFIHLNRIIRVLLDNFIEINWSRSHPNSLDAINENEEQGIKNN